MTSLAAAPLSSPKSATESAFIIVVGMASLAVAFFNQHFFWRRGWFSGGKPAPRWVGQLLFGLGGLLFIILGIRDLLFAK